MIRERSFHPGLPWRRVPPPRRGRGSPSDRSARVARFLLLFLCALSCRTRPALRIEPVGAAASTAMAEAQAWLRAADAPSRDASRARAREAAERALAAAPGWVAPRRLLDNLLQDDLRGVEALQALRARLAHEPVEAGDLYLTGRLEGADGYDRFERAARLDPSLSFAHHGLAFSASRRGETREAIQHGRRALELARDPWERAFFSASLARFLVAADRRDDALRLLDARERESDISAGDRIALSVQAVGIGLDAPSIRTRVNSYERGLELLRNADLTEEEIDEMVTKMVLSSSPDDPDSLQLQVALAARASPARDRLRAELMLDSGSTPLALGLIDRAFAAQGRFVPAGPLMRAARFAAGEYEEAVDRWLSGLPARVLADGGLPADEKLARVVSLARRVRGSRAPGTSQPTQLVELGAALIDAGWFREARAVAEHIPKEDLDAALALQSKALAGQEFIESLKRLVRRVDLEQASSATAASGNADGYRIRHDGEGATRIERLGERSGIRDLKSLLASMGPPLSRAHVFLGGESDPARLARQLSTSPRMRYFPIAELAHPGPWYSRNDERDGLGREGEIVGGLARELSNLGRFGLFGEVSGGGGPDGTLLPRVYAEERSGEHLGVPWSGTVVYCESAELKSRAGRRGAHISAAALHEGYWLDIDAVRGERAVWSALRRQFDGADAPQSSGSIESIGSIGHIERVLAVRGLAIESDASDEERASRERRRSGFLLGEAQRVRLAVLKDRARAGPDGAQLGEVDLDELVEVTATHEEGHLCDRTRYLPVGKHLPELVLFALDCGLSPARIGEALEYRAQLVSLCDAFDARIPLAQVLDAAEQGASGLTPHAAGYARLLSDLLTAFDEDLAQHPAAYPSIDPRFTLAHQLHLLGPDAVRHLAREVAKRKRLFA